MPRYVTPKQKVMGAPNFGNSVGVYQNFLKQLALRWWPHHCDITAIFLKNDVIFVDVTGSSNFVRRFAFLQWFINCLSQVSNVTKTSHDVIWIKYWPKNAQISESDFCKLQNRETFRYLSNFRFSRVICNEVWLKVKLIWNGFIFVKEFITKTTERRKKRPLRLK